MPWYYRRSFGKGPFRLNLSRRGVGMSVGVKGFRVGTGPRGAYVRAGRGGFYYQQYLSAPSARPPQLPASPSPHPGPAVPPSPAVHQTVLGTPVEFVGDLEQSSDAFVADLNRRRRSLRWSTPSFWMIAVAVIGAAVSRVAAPWYVVGVAAVVGALVLRHRENAERAIIITYDLDDASVHRYDALCAAFRIAASSSITWRLATELALSEGRRHGGATTLITRSPARIGFGGGADMTTNVQPPVVALANARVYFLPDKVLIVARNTVSSLAYRELRVIADPVDFREEGPVPRDATVVGTTWMFVNKSGTPDRRFNNNRQIPIVRYSELTVQHHAMSFVLQFSKQDVAIAVAAALRTTA
jgi:hypothetical protein